MQRNAHLAKLKRVRSARYGMRVWSRFFDVGEQGDDPYLVFEYVEGLNLDQYVRSSGTLDTLRVAQITVQMLNALSTLRRTYSPRPET